jgi:epoxyqueuosine reductase QueG
MSLKSEFVTFARDELGIPLVGVAPADDYSPDDSDRIAFVVRTFAKATPIATGADTPLQPRDFLSEARSVIVTGMPTYTGEATSFEDCRKDLLGRNEASHVNVPLLQSNAETSAKISEFFAAKGFQCFSAVGSQFPIKLMASKCGVGFYGKNCIIQHPDFGSWITLSAFVSDAPLEPDPPLADDCGKCEACIKACPTAAIFAPYRHDITKCIDFHLGHNKKLVPRDIRENCGNLIGEGCTACRDVCPKNRELTPIKGFETPENLLYPPLLKLAQINDDEWEKTFESTLLGYFLIDKRYIKRNATIALGNFKDDRALPVLAQLLNSGEDEVRGYAAWAIGRIGGPAAKKHLRAALAEEENEEAKEEIECALAFAQ